ncbi:MAG: amylo-alpha-1,6-glucosidase, partial [Flavipsychrobacter sp.]
YWFGSWGRDTFISLPGLTLAQGDVKTFKSVINGMLPDIKDGVVPNVGTGANAAYNTVDASLWFIWAIQQYAHYTKDDKATWKSYGKALQSILEYYRKGTLNNIKMDDDYLISAGVGTMALTWMDAVIDGKAVTPRKGKNVEINALWYNAVCFCLQLARAVNDKQFLEEWTRYPEKIAASFIAKFWNDDLQYLADYISPEHTDYSIRPNQIFAVALPYSPLPEHMRRAVVDIVKEELLTPRGLRTLSPQDPQYIGQYAGDQATRDKAYHQGTVWPWLIGPFLDAYLKENNDEAVAFAEKIYHDFESALFEKCLYTVSEIYSGDAPHKVVGTVAQAWSVAELLRIKNVIAEYKQRVPAALETNTRL